MITQTKAAVSANELRIGNLINTITHKDYCIITGIKRQTVKDGNYDSIIVNDEKENHFLPEQMLPIPLTPEILEKTSLKYSEGYDDVKGWKINYDLWLSMMGEHTWYIGYEIEDSIRWHSLARICEPFLYLHQLQNAYFALTGTELTINL